MRKDHLFRPRLWEILEARAVPSLAGVTIPTGLPGVSVTLPAQFSPPTAPVRAAFEAFDASYVRAVDAILLAPGPDGLVVPSSNRAAFDSAVGRSLDALAAQLVASLSTASATPAATSQVDAAIVGGGSTSLQGQLLAQSVATIQLQAAVPPLTPTPPSVAVANAVDTAEQVRATVRVPVAEATGPSAATVAPASTAGASTRAADAVRSGFNAFLGDYFKAMQNTLLAPGAGGQVAPAANRAAFDAEVDQALRSLRSKLAAALTDDPAASSLAPRVLSAIQGDGPSSLKAQLAALATPEAAQAAVVREFTLGSTGVIARALALIGGSIAGR